MENSRGFSFWLYCNTNKQKYCIKGLVKDPLSLPDTVLNSKKKKAETNM